MGRLLDAALDRLEKAHQGAPFPHETTHLPGGSDALRTAAPSHPTGTAAAEGTGTALMRADATIRQGIVTTKGDILGYSSAPDRLPGGHTGQVLFYNNDAALGFQWGIPTERPGQITSNQDDYPASNGQPGLWLLSTDASRDITGVDANQNGIDGLIVTIINVGANDLVLKHENAGSLAVNRLLCPGAADLTLHANEGAELIYDGTILEWRVFAK